MPLLFYLIAYLVWAATQAPLQRHPEERCDGTGAPADEMFTLAFPRGESFGLTTAAASRGVYALADKDTVSALYTPLKAPQFNGIGTGYLTAHKTSKGNYTVTLPGDIRGSRRGCRIRLFRIAH